MKKLNFIPKNGPVSFIETHNFKKNVSLVMYRPSCEIRR